MSQDVRLQLYYDDQWNDVPLFASPVELRWELDDDGIGRVKCTCEIDNTTGAYDPSDPESTLYGKVRRNIPARILHDDVGRRYGECSSFKPDQTPDFDADTGRGRRWVKLTFEGVSRRIGRWTDPLRSPMYRTISARSTSVGHWPLEDGRDALQASASKGVPATVRDVTFGEDEAPFGAEQTVKISADSEMTGRFASATTTAGWQIGFSFKLDALPSSATYNNLLNWTTSNGYSWWLDVNDTTYQLEVYDQLGHTLLFSNNVAFGSGAAPDQWITFRVKASQSGGDIDISEGWYPQGAEVLYQVTDSFTGTVGALRQWWQYGDAAIEGAHFSHVFGVTGTTDDLLSSVAVAVFNGYLGEAAGTRFLRLCTELGITKYIGRGTSGDTTAMGPQRADTFFALLKEICATDDAIIYDERWETTGAALTMSTRRGQYDLDPDLELTYPGDITPPLTKVIDDLPTANVVTAKNRDGGDYTSIRTEGPMGTDPDTGAGEYRKTIDANVADEHVLVDLADWGRAKGTLDRPRYETVLVDVVTNSSLLADCKAIALGGVIRLAGLPGGTIDLRVLGIVERITPATYTFEFTVEPYDVWRTAVYDGTTLRYDARETTLDDAVNSTATALTFTYPYPSSEWSTDGDSLPYDVMIAGERVRVTAMGAKTGSGPYTQDATVTRSINGVVKSLPSGAEIHIADPARYAF